MTDTNPGIEAINRLGAVLASNPWFWVFFLAAFAFITISSLEALRRRWLRAGIAGFLALECAVILAGGYAQ